jgi:hypothetical protein
MSLHHVMGDKRVPGPKVTVGAYHCPLLEKGPGVVPGKLSQVLNYGPVEPELSHKAT